MAVDGLPGERIGFCFTCGKTTLFNPPVEQRLDPLDIIRILTDQTELWRSYARTCIARLNSQITDADLERESAAFTAEQRALIARYNKIAKIPRIEDKITLTPYQERTGK